MTAEERKARRTVGLKIFDNILYTGLANTGVFLISVGATYLTNRGHTQFKPGTLMDSVGKFFHSRGTMLEEFLMRRGMPKGSAEMTKMVGLSFLDGSLVAPLVKVAEDHREEIGKKIDDALGTTPTDLSVYQKEPKQTWGTVFMGRLATAAVVVPIAATLDKTHIMTKSGKKSLNDAWFRDSGIKTGEWVQNKPKIARLFKNLDIREIFRVTYFEAFYTSVCTLGLYFSSRAFARRHDQQTGRLERDPVTNHVTVHPTAQNDNDLIVAQNDNPPTHVVSEVSQSRLMDGAPVLAANR